MKVAAKVVLLFKDPDGFGSAIAGALHPNPNSSFHRLEESFQLPLDRYGIKDQKASGDLVHFLDSEGNYQVSLVLFEKYDPPILVCALNEVLTQITVDALPELPTLIVPFAGPSSKLKWENKDSAISGSKTLVYGVQMGPETDTIRAIAAKTQKPSPLLQIHYEPVACLLQLVRVLKLPTFILVGRRCQNLPNKALGEDMEIIGEIGDLLATTVCLGFLRDKMTWDPVETSRKNVEPWRALYG